MDEQIEKLNQENEQLRAIITRMIGATVKMGLPVLAAAIKSDLDKVGHDT